MGWFQPRRPNPEGERPRVRPRPMAELHRGPRVSIKLKIGLVTVYRVTDRLQIAPLVSISSHGQVHDGAHARPSSDELADRPIGPTARVPEQRT
jgi:hypothetical protein